MAQDSLGNDLTQVDLPITAALAIASYSQTNVLASAAGGGAKVTLPEGYRRLGLIKQDGGANESMDQDSPIEFFQKGYKLSLDPTISIQWGLAEFNKVVRELITGKAPDENGMITVSTWTPDTKWLVYYEEVYKSGRIRRLNGVMQVTGTEIDQSERNSVKGRNVTLEWQTDPLIGDGVTSLYNEWQYDPAD
ncbi:hypothetical protein EP30_01075 [Bifidobacterium sp. UTCIF-39]|uniref:hypothetical protein n=1 Tax=Bifidobacterium sp. UTCIF-39 TaxID=1465359 RepID=UPI001129F844|nr:hypothetical protein [Bifidobacterium sp. UTCIF-39]TPF97564.1 hypothetical protein EP30_01075 [Bifidobacterium sp. UTCIF-39]